MRTDQTKVPHTLYMVVARNRHSACMSGMDTREEEDGACICIALRWIGLGRDEPEPEPFCWRGATRARTWKASRKEEATNRWAK